MNVKEKIIAAIKTFNTQSALLQEAEAEVMQRRMEKEAAKDELVRVLHGTLGDRAQKGVLFETNRYYADNGQLTVEKIDFEVL